MPDLIFYRQGRVDGGIRTAIELDGDTIYERFDEGGPERNPVLLWYVDLRCKGAGLPHDPEGAKRWLLDHEELIRDGFARFAAEVEAGSDVELYPLQWSKFPQAPEGVELTIACATNRRNWALSISKLLEDVGSHWRELIEGLEAAEWVS
ncbi:MAG TPA: hypothetical protein VGZ22_28295 [Isosphaeraceae bacterium]|nr:hypothetical protein [Isosphaeraceae bacterium]